MNNTGQLAAAGAAVVFGIGVVAVVTGNAGVALALAVVGFLPLGVAWGPVPALRRAAVFGGSVLVLSWLTAEFLSRLTRPAGRVPDQPGQAVQRITGVGDVLGALVQFEFGRSQLLDESLGTVLVERAAYDAVLVGYALVLAATVVGVLRLVSRTGYGRTVARALAHLASALPAVGWALVLVVVSVTFDVGHVLFDARVVQRSGFVSADAVARYLLPALALALPVAGHVLRESLALDGDLPDGAHATLPTVATHWIHLGYFVGAIVLVDFVFQIPGVGWLWYQGLINQDYLAVAGATLVLAVVGLFALLVRDAVLSAVDEGRVPWADYRDRATRSDGEGRPAHSDGGEQPRPSLATAVRSSRTASVGAGLLGVGLVLAVYGHLAVSPRPLLVSPGGPDGVPPGLGDAAVGIGRLLYVGGGATLLAAVVGVPLGVLAGLRGPVTAVGRDLLRTVTAFPLLPVVYLALPTLAGANVVGDLSSDATFAIAVGVVLLPFVALSTAAVGGATRERAPIRRNPRRDPVTDGDASGAAPGDVDAPGRGGWYAPVAIPLSVCFGYAVFLAVGVVALGLVDPAAGNRGLEYTIEGLRGNADAVGVRGVAVLGATVGIPVAGANLLADGLRDAMFPAAPAGSDDRSAGEGQESPRGERPRDRLLDRGGDGQRDRAGEASRRADRQRDPAGGESRDAIDGSGDGDGAPDGSESEVEWQSVEEADDPPGDAAGLYADAEQRSLVDRPDDAADRDADTAGRDTDESKSGQRE